VPAAGDLPGAIEVFFRVVTSNKKRDSNLPFLLYLQGGSM
jgi:hypothetical protein